MNVDGLKELGKEVKKLYNEITKLKKHKSELFHALVKACPFYMNEQPYNKCTHEKNDMVLCSSSICPMVVGKPSNKKLKKHVVRAPKKKYIGREKRLDTVDGRTIYYDSATASGTYKKSNKINVWCIDDDVVEGTKDCTYLSSEDSCNRNGTCKGPV